MKKYFLMVVMLFTMSLCSFAEDANTDEINKVERYDIKINLRRLGTFLDLNTDQIESVESIENEFHNDLMFAAVENLKDTRISVTRNVINKHIKHMRYILNDEQMHKYLIVLNATVRNRELLEK